MLNLTDKNGLSIWVGDNKNQAEVIKKKIKYPSNLYFLERHSEKDAYKMKN